MVCPFPGTDPFIENDNWQHFHAAMIIEIIRQLAPQLPGGYRISAEVITKNYIDEDGAEAKSEYVSPDIGILSTGEGYMANDDGGVATLTPLTRKTKIPPQVQREVRIYAIGTGQLVTAIEVLSPANKLSAGSIQHVNKLRSYRALGVNAMDIDLLRKGQPPYGIYELPPEPDGGYLTPYHVVLSMPPDEVNSWDVALIDVLPTVPVPLEYPDKPIILNIQKAFSELYTYSTYPKRTAEQLSKLRPALTEEEHAKLAEYLLTRTTH